MLLVPDAQVEAEVRHHPLPHGIQLAPERELPIKVVHDAVDIVGQQVADFVGEQPYVI